MDILGWLWWLLLKALALLWGLVWLLLGGWVATAAQIAVIALAVFAYKYGWRRAPQELASRIVPIGRMLWGWLRGREIAAAAAAAPAKPAPATRKGQAQDRRRSAAANVSLSTVLNVLMLTGLGLLAVL